MHQQQIIQDFLKLSGVVGVGLINGQLEPYLHFKETLESPEKETISQNILKLSAKIPEEFELFEIKILGYYTYIYKLRNNLSLLVITRTDIVAVKVLAAKQLKAALQENLDSAVSMFWLLTRKNARPLVVSSIVENIESRPSLGDNNKLLPVEITIEELLTVFNHLSKISSNYIGTKVTTSYWQSTRPNFEWLENFQINQSAEMVFSGIVTEKLNTLQIQHLKEWINNFIKRCTKIIRDFPIIVQQKDLDQYNNNLFIRLISSI